jgi:hypothetical protein
MSARERGVVPTGICPPAWSASFYPSLPCG